MSGIAHLPSVLQLRSLCGKCKEVPGSVAGWLGSTARYKQHTWLGCDYTSGCVCGAQRSALAHLLRDLFALGITDGALTSISFPLDFQPMFSVIY